MHNLVLFLYLIMPIYREVGQWLERGALPMSLPTVRFRTRLVHDQINVFTSLNIGTLFRSFPLVYDAGPNERLPEQEAYLVIFRTEYCVINVAIVTEE